MNATWESPGSRWWRVDLHAHTPASPDWDAAEEDGDAADETPWLRWLEAARDAKLDAVAVTDHNTAEGVGRLQELQAKVEGAPVLFPGVELTTENGTHLLLLADPGTGRAEIDDILARVGVDSASRGTKEARSPHGVLDILDEVGNKMLVVAAHVNRRRGLLQTYESGSFGKILTHDALVAVEVDPDAEFTDDQERWLDGRVPEIRRRIPQIWSSDGHHCDQLGQRFTWVKMARPTLDGLRLALLDAEGSIRRDRSASCSAEPPHAGSYLHGIAVRDGRYMGCGEPFEIAFSPWLTAIIGGRGTGKSTLVDFLRKTLRRDNELEAGGRDREGALRKSFDSRMSVPAPRTVEGLLREETQVRAFYWKDDQRFQLGWSQDGKVPAIGRFSGGGLVEEHGDIRERFPVRIYSQKQLFALAQEPKALLTVIDDAHPVQGASFRRRLAELESHYLSLRAESRAAATTAAALETHEASLADLRRKLAVMEKSGYATVLMRHRRFRRLDDTWTQLAEQALGAIRRTAREADELEVADLDLAADRESPGADGLADAYESLKTVMARTRADVGETLRDAEKEVQDVMSGDASRSWQQATRHAENAFEGVVAKLSNAGVSKPDEYNSLLSASAELTREIDRLKRERERARRLTHEALGVLEEYRRVRRDWSEKRVAFARNLSGDGIEIVIEPLSDMTKLAEDIGRRLGVSHYENDRTALAERLRAAEKWEPELDRIVADLSGLRRGDGELPIKDKRFRKTIVGRPADAIDHLTLYLPEDAVMIRFKDRTTGKWKPIGLGSPGQQTAALLSLVLSYGSEPIVLDQPEDDLDNSLIYDLVVSRLKEVKNERQVIVITHNPNIVVHGDAEYVLSFGSVNGRTTVTRQGGLPDPDVREEICRVMEGGREAFESRFKKILFTPWASGHE